MSRWPIRLRLTAAFAFAMVLVLVAAGLFVYVRVRAELDDSVSASLRSRAELVAARAGARGEGLATGVDPEESFAQLLSSSGALLEGSGGPARPALAGGSLARARRGTVMEDAAVDGIEGTARVLARPASERPGSPVVVVGESLDDRDETLAGLLAAFAVGGPIAVAIASLLGYLVASAALRPVESMRRRASEVSLERDDPLPLPAARDEIRRLGETLNEMLDRLRGSFERERRFVADASHELRTPVAVLKAEIEAAVQDGSYGPQVKDSLQAALGECDHLAQLAEDLLTLARAGEGGLELRRETQGARGLLEGVRERFSYRARLEERTIAVAAADDLAVTVDPLRMRQALGNLVDNALRHGGGEIKLSAEHADGALELTVTDCGPGFAPEVRPGAFDRFTRGDAARARGGAGLGLAIVQEIARAHGGEAEILPGEGAGVRMRVPAG